MKKKIRLNEFERNPNNFSRVKYAEQAILMLPPDTFIRNSWLRCYGITKEARNLRKKEGLLWLDKYQCSETFKQRDERLAKENSINETDWSKVEPGTKVELSYSPGSFVIFLVMVENGDRAVCAFDYDNGRSWTTADYKLQDISLYKEPQE